ncbi:MAG: phytanoyl-CoA dioxygenase family protein [Candidatus Sericytochromatia bacterium]
MLNPFFKDNKNQEEFIEKGYVKITTPTISSEIIAELMLFLENSGIKEYSEEAVYMAMENKDKLLLRKMYEVIKTAMFSVLDDILINPVFFFGTFIIKYPNSKVTVLPHQDGTLVEDEVNNYTLTCWVPLVDVDRENGCMGLIKKSNQIYNSIRPLPSPQVYRPLSKHAFSIMPYFELVPMKAGEILIFDNKTFHISPPNVSNKERIAISSWVYQKGTDLRMYYLKPGTKNKLLKYAIDEDFYLKYDNTILSKMYDENKLIEDYQIIDELDYKYQDFSKNEMKKQIESKGNKRDNEFYNYMFQYFPNEMRTNYLSKLKEIFK